jgi:hypothetical protein
MQGNLVRAAYLIGAIVVLSFGDTDLVVAAIAHGLIPVALSIMRV